MARAAGTLLVAAVLAAGPLHLPAAAQPAGPAGAPRPLWFEPTQLPSFTGTVERYLTNPAGEVDALIFREGPQIIFPPDIANALRETSPVGRPLVAFGIRARAAPVITMLGYAPPGETPPVMLDRFYWRQNRAAPQAERLSAEGVVKQPYWSAQGEAIGAVLEDGTVIVLPRERLEPFRELLKAGARIAAEGRGHAGEGGRAILADRVGEKHDALRPVADTAAPR